MKTSLTIAALLVATTATLCPAQEIKREAPDMFATRELESTAQPGKGDQLVVRAAGSLRGQLTIKAARTDRALLTYTKRAHTSRESKAVDYLDQIAVSLNGGPGGLRLELRAPNPPPWTNDESGLVEASLEIPEGFKVKIDAAYFDIDAEGPFLSFENTTSLGRLDVAHVSQFLEVETANRRITVTDISGEIRVSTTNSTLTAEGINHLTQPAMLRNDGGDIRINSLSGGLNVKNAYGRIEIIDWDPGDEHSYVRCTSGPITVSLSDLETGQLSINNRYEDIELRLPAGFSGVLALAVDDGGKIEAENFPFTTELVEPNRLNLQVGDGVGLVSGSIRGKGNIYVTAEE